VAPSHRGGTLYFDLGVTTGPPLIGHGVRLTFGASEPHLVSFYAEMGQRPYANRNFFSEESGYLIPNVVFNQGVEAFGDDPPACVQHVLTGDCAVRNAVLDGEVRYAELVRRLLSGVTSESSLFRGFADEEIDQCTARSTLIRCRAGDQILKTGGTARNPFVVVSGRLEARTGDPAASVLHPGDLFGESGLLGNDTRGADVFVTDAATEILALSERTLRKVMDSEPQIGVKLLANMATTLWCRLRDRGLLTG